MGDLINYNFKKRDYVVFYDKANKKRYREVDECFEAIDEIELFCAKKGKEYWMIIVQPHQIFTYERVEFISAVQKPEYIEISYNAGNRRMDIRALDATLFRLTRPLKLEQLVRQYGVANVR